MKPQPTRLVRGPVPFLFLAGMGLGAVLLSSGLLLLLFGLTSYARLQELGHITYHELGYKQLTLALTPARFQLLRGLLGAAAGLSAGLLWALHRYQGAAMRRERRRLRQEIQLAWTGLRRLGRELSGQERAVGLGLLTLILTLRAWHLSTAALDTDEIASYDYFVRPGLLAITISCSISAAGSFRCSATTRGW